MQWVNAFMDWVNDPINFGAVLLALVDFVVFLIVTISLGAGLSKLRRQVRETHEELMIQVQMLSRAQNARDNGANRGQGQTYPTGGAAPRSTQQPGYAGQPGQPGYGQPGQGNYPQPGAYPTGAPFGQAGQPGFVPGGNYAPPGAYPTGVQPGYQPTQPVPPGAVAQARYASMDNDPLNQ